MKKKERLFREAVKASLEATSVKIDKTGELFVRAPWARDTESGGWYWVGAADDVDSDLRDTETNGNGKNSSRKPL